MSDSVSIVDVPKLMAAPEEILDLNKRDMHSISNDDIVRIHLKGVQDHFSAMIEKVPMLTRLAKEHGISEIKDLADAGPLLVPHSVYKSYPLSVLEQGRCDKLTKWLNTLTAHDLSGLNADSCQSIDEWIALLDSQTDIRVKHSSGTTGKLSFIPRSAIEYPSAAKGFKLFFDNFYDEPDAELDAFGELPIIVAGYRRGAMGMARLLDAVSAHFHGGDPSMIIPQFPGYMSADLLSLGGRLEGAQQRGELGDTQLSPNLIARRDQFLEEQANKSETNRLFYERIGGLKGRRVIINGTPPQIYDMAVAGLEAGLSNMFAPNSLVYVAGGYKGRVLPDNYKDVIREFLGLETFPAVGYGMTEMVASAHNACRFGNFHIRPHIVPFILDPQTGEQKPRHGVQKGRFGFIELATKTHWGGFLSGDEVALHWGDDPCPCGRTGAYVEPQVRRYGAEEGGDDKITCAGAPGVHDRALDLIAQALG